MEPLSPATGIARLYITEPHVEKLPPINVFDQELQKLGEELLDKLVLYQAKQQWNKELREGVNPYREVKSPLKEITEFVHYNLKNRFEKHSEKLHAAVIPVLNQVIEAMCQHRSIHHHEIPFMLKLPKHGLSIPKKVIPEILDSLDDPKLMGEFIATGELRSGFTDMFDLSELLNALNHHADIIREVLKLQNDKSEVANFILYADKQIQQFESGKDGCLDVKWAIIEIVQFLKTFEITKELCESYLNTVSVTFLDGHDTYTLASLLAIRKLSPVIDKTIAFHKKHGKPLYDFTKTEIAKSEFNRIRDFATNKLDKPEISPYCLVSYTTARILLIPHLQKCYLEQFDNKLTSIENVRIELPQLMIELQLQTDPQFSGKLLDALLNILDEQPNDFETFFQLYQICTKVAEDTRATEKFANRIFVHFPYLIQGLKDADITEKEYAEELQDMKILFGLVDIPKEDIYKQIQHCSIADSLGVSSPIVERELQEAAKKFLESTLKPNELITMATTIRDSHLELERPCLTKILKVLNGLNVYFNVMHVAQLFLLGYQLAEKKGIRSGYAEDLFHKFSKIIACCLKFELLREKATEVFVHMQRLLDCMPASTQLHVDLSYFHVTMDQLSMLVPLRIHSMTIKTGHLLSNHRFHTSDRTMVQSLFPKTRITWK